MNTKMNPTPITSLGVVSLIAIVACTSGCPSTGPTGTTDPTDPSISASASALSFTGLEGGVNPTDQTLGLTVASAESMDWTATSNADWLFVQPAGGTAATTDSVTVSVDTTGLTAAESPYTGQLTITAAGATNSPLTIPVTLSLTDASQACAPLSDIDEDTTLAAGCYLADQSISVSDGAMLTLDPGVTIYFGEGHELTVSSGGRLSAQGTADQPIVLTGMEAIRGYWGGLRFYQSNSMDNVLDHVTVAYGGGYWDGNVTVTGSSSAPSRVAITNCTIRDSETYGLYLSECVLDTFSGNTITANTLGAGYATPDTLTYLDDTSTYTGNDEDVVVVPGGSVSAEATWSGIDAAYQFAGSLLVSAPLAINAGATLMFGQNQQMTIDQNGRLDAVGTADAPIVLTGEEAIRGYWGGLRFYQSNSTDNAMDYVTIEYGGGYWDANLYITGTSSSPARVAVTNCIIRESGSYGFMMNDSMVTAFGGNTITGNTDGAGYVTADSLRFLDDTSTYVDNDEDAVIIGGGTTTEDATWPAIDARYRFAGSCTIASAVTIDPGAQLVFESGISMTVNSDGSLAAVGTEDAGITFTGVEQTPGYWGGLRYYQSNATANALDYVTIEYGGGYWDANLYLTGSSSLPTQIAVTNSTFQNSSTWGIYISQANTNEDISEANTFFDNASGDVGEAG